MKLAVKVTGTLLLSLLFVLMVFLNPALSMSDGEIFDWVADELKIKKDYAMPKILFVSKKNLQKVFKKYNENSFKRWAEQYGKEHADKIMDMYLKEVIGLFNPKGKTIYVGKFLQPCERQAITAHEIIHYFQVMENGPEDPLSHGATAIRLLKEMQASDIEEKFKETFCYQDEPFLSSIP